MEQKNYETVFILTPVLSENQLKEVVDKYKKIIKDNGAKIIHEENWGMKKLAYRIQHKSSGFYQLFQYIAPSEIVITLDTEFRRDDKILRFLTLSLDKYALEFNERRNKGLLKSQKASAEKKTDPLPPSAKPGDKSSTDAQKEQAISQSKPSEPAILEGDKNIDDSPVKEQDTDKKSETVNAKD